MTNAATTSFATGVTEPNLGSAASAPRGATTSGRTSEPASLAPPLPVLVLAVGNPSRGDDALGPLLVARLRELALSDVELLEDFQLQPEHVLDLAGREEVVLVDADVGGEDSFRFEQVTPAADNSVTTHALSPAALLAVYGRVVDAPPPPTWLLAIRGCAFDLGAPLSARAAANLEAAAAMLAARLGSRDRDHAGGGGAPMDAGARAVESIGPAGPG